MRRAIALTAATLLAACAPTGPQPAASGTPDTAPATSSAVTPPTLGGDLAPYRALDAWNAPNANIVLSPFGIRQAFGLAHLSAAGGTAGEIETLFGLPPGQDAAAMLPAQRRALLDSGEGVRIRIANALWLSRDWRFRPTFIDAARRFHDAPSTMLDYRGNRAQAAATINDWARKSTEGLIPAIVTESDIDPDTAAYLTNAVFFDGEWQTPFLASETRPFLRGDGREMPFHFMKRIGRYRLAEQRGWRAVRLPYGQAGRFVLDVMLPAKRGPLPAGLPGTEIEALAKALDAAQPVERQLFLPRFEIDFRSELRPALEAAGLRLPFDAGRADLSGMAEPGQRRLFIDRVLHAARLQVYEDGTRAAAVTALRVVPVSAPPPWRGADFRVDHSFLFAIRDTKTGTLLFFGRVTDPRPYTPPPPPGF